MSTKSEIIFISSDIELKTEEEIKETAKEIIDIYNSIFDKK